MWDIIEGQKKLDTTFPNTTSLDIKTTSPIEVNDVKIIAILDSGANIAIATKNVWEAWGKPAFKKTRMKLKLVVGL